MRHFRNLATAFAVTMALLTFGLAACSRPASRNPAGHPSPAGTASAATTTTAPAAAATRPAPAPTPPAPAATGALAVSRAASMKVGPLTRSWVTITPARALPRTAPIIVELSGIGNTVSVESTRNRLLPYVAADQAELVYPVAIRQSWNAGGCCGAAGNLKVDDVAFLEKLVPRVDPGHKRPVYFVGYSNGGRMVYALECADPGLFDGMAAVKADPLPGCVVARPQNVLVISALDDPAVPYRPGETGRETPSATVQIARLHAALGCPATPAAARHGDMTLTTWSACAGGKQLGWAVYAVGGHNFPPPTKSSPSGSQIIWSFFTRTALAPLPA